MPNNEGARGGREENFSPKPAHQATANVPPSANPGHFVGRGVPDVSGDADPVTGYDVYVDGQASVIGGTSAVAPLWAGLTACINQMIGKRVGALTSLVYSQIAPVNGTFHDITSGNNGKFPAQTGRGPLNGWGNPGGAATALGIT